VPRPAKYPWGWHRTTIVVPRELMGLYEKLREMAEDKGMSFNELLWEIILDWAERNGITFEPFRPPGEPLDRWLRRDVNKKIDRA